MRATRSWPYLLALFLTILATRLWLIHTYTVAMPFWDQWDAEGWSLLKPWQEGQLSLGALFAAHNEHRIVITRLVTLALFTVTRSWNPILEAQVNAFGYAVFALGVAIAVIRLLGVKYRFTVLLAVAVCFSLPFGWENTICGFQSQSYFLIAFSLIAIWGMTLQARYSAGWWLGVTGAVLACFSMGSGFLAAGCILAIEIVTRRDKATIFVCSLILALGLLLIKPVPENAGLHAHGSVVFILAFSRCLAWPLTQFPLMAGWIVLPLLVLGIAYWRSVITTPFARFLLLVAIWWSLQLAAVAFSRGNTNGFPPSRYKDLFVIGILAAFLALLLLNKQGHLSPAWIAIWLLPVVWGLSSATNFALREVSERHRFLEIGAANVRGYLATGDYERYLENKALLELPYPRPERLKMMLDDPTIRSLLPQ